jgi:hypothetical protein
MSKKECPPEADLSFLEEVQDYLYMEDDCVDRLTGKSMPG